MVSSVIEVPCVFGKKISKFVNELKKLYDKYFGVILVKLGSISKPFILLFNLFQVRRAPITKKINQIEINNVE